MAHCDEDVEKIIYNCHVHTFTIDHVPPFLGRGILGWFMKRRTLQRLVIPALSLLSRIRWFAKLLRYANYLAITTGKDQRDVLERLQQRYPWGTKFVVLPMDLAWLAGADPIESSKDIDEQHAELLVLSRCPPSHRQTVIPFFAVDPRRPNVAAKLKQGIADGFRGIKIYPNLGYSPSHPGLTPVWELANEHRLPVMTHCSRGGMHGYDLDKKRKVNKKLAEEYGAPHLYADVLKAYPNMKLCLAHLGGQEEWENYLQNPWPLQGKALSERTWIAQILSMIPEHENLYADVSYTVFYFQKFAPALKVFLADPVVRTRILFGSDYYMADLENEPERTLSINLRAALGERLFWQIANANPKKFLY